MRFNCTKTKNHAMNKSRTSLITGLCVVLLVCIGLLSGCGENNQIVGEWHMTKVLVGDKEYDAMDFLDPSKKSNGSFVIKFYGDETLIATGSLGTDIGASEGEWEKESENKFTITIDDQEREVELVEDLLFMDIKIEEASMVVIFERQ